MVDAFDADLLTPLLHRRLMKQITKSKTERATTIVWGMPDLAKPDRSLIHRMSKGACAKLKVSTCQMKSSSEKRRLVLGLVLVGKRGEHTL